MNDDMDIYKMLTKRLLIVSVAVTVWLAAIVYGAYTVAKTIAPLFKQEGNFND